jgi:hypothetical protein
MADQSKDEKAPQSSDAPKKETVNEQPNAKAAGPDYVDTVEVSKDDFPSVEDEDVNVERGDAPYENEGWTVQHVDRDGDERSYVVPEAVPGYTVTKDELPTREGLEALGVDPVAYVAAVPVVEA